MAPPAGTGKTNDHEEAFEVIRTGFSFGIASSAVETSAVASLFVFYLRESVFFC